MLVEQIMTKDVFSLKENATIQEALDAINQKRIRHIPVVNDRNELIGIVSDRDIRSATPSIFYADEHKEVLLKPISTIMKRDVITAHPLDFVEEASALLYEHDIGCLPICEDDRLVGIVTETDILHTLVQLMGAHQPSSQIEIRVENVSGKLADIANIIKKQNVSIVSVLLYPCQDPNYKILVFRLQTMDPRAIIEAIKKEGYEVLWPNFPGVEL